MTAQDIQDALNQAQQAGTVVQPTPGGVSFKDAAPLLASVVDNGVCPDDPRVLKRLNEATKIILDSIIPVGGMQVAYVTALKTVLVLPPTMETAIEAYPLDAGTSVRGDKDITQSWYEIVDNSTYLDPSQQHDNPLQDLGLWPLGTGQDSFTLVRLYAFDGLQPDNAVVVVTGSKRYVPLTGDSDFLIVQNLEALKMMILSIERNENSLPDEAQKYRQQAMDMLQGEVKKHLMDPRNYMRRKSEYFNDLQRFAPDTLGWMRAQLALDVKDALKVGKRDLTWTINQSEKRLMQKAIYKDCIIEVQADVVGGIVYFPPNVDAVLAVDLEGRSIPIRSEFFEHLDNGPGMFACHSLLKDMGDEYFPATQTVRRKYKLVADCSNVQCLNAICRVRWLAKKPSDRMVIKNYEALRLMVTAKFLEETQDWQNSTANQQSAYEILDKELASYLGGIRHTVHIQTWGFGLGDVGRTL